MGERNSGFAIAALMAMASGAEQDAFIDQFLNPKCAKCGAVQKSQNDLIDTSHGMLCAPCILGLNEKGVR